MMDSSTASGVLGVGLLGAGPVVQAIHLPTLARLTDRFAVAHIMDVDPVVAESVAGRVGAAFSTSLDDLLADPAVDVVAICSPAQFHASQVVAALRAGKKAVLCEKPFATTREEAEEIARVSEETGVPIIVGAMHAFDPGWLEVAKVWGDLAATAHTIRSSIVLPGNQRYEDWATEVVSRPSPGSTPEVTAEFRAGLVASGVLGLAIHDLPLVRTFLPAFDSAVVVSAEAFLPFGYAIGLHAGDRTVQLIGTMNLLWKPSWEFEAISDTQSLHIDFTPSYVHAGSAVATLTAADGSSRIFGSYGHDGYEGEWRILHDVASGDRTAAPALATLIDDLTFAVDIAEASASLIRQETFA